MGLRHKAENMSTVHSLDEARQWFLRNPGKSVKCVRDSRSRVCSTFEQAVEWYTSRGEDG